MPYCRDVFDTFSSCEQKGTRSINEWLPRLNTYREECHESVRTILHTFNFINMKIVNIFLFTAWYWFQLFRLVLLPIMFTCARLWLYKKRKNTTESIASEADRCAAEYKWDWILSRCLCSWLNRLMLNSFSFHRQTQEDHIFPKKTPYNAASCQSLPIKLSKAQTSRRNAPPAVYLMRHEKYLCVCHCDEYSSLLLISEGTLGHFAGSHWTFPWAVDSPPSSNPSWQLLSPAQLCDYQSFWARDCVAGHRLGWGGETGIDCSFDL